MKIQNSKQFQKKATHAAALLKALSHPERLLILCRLAEGEKSAGDLCNQSELSQSALSQHLAVLKNQSIVKARKEAQMVYYTIDDPKVAKILSLMHELYCK